MDNAIQLELSSRSSHAGTGLLVGSKGHKMAQHDAALLLQASKKQQTCSQSGHWLLC